MPKSIIFFIIKHMIKLIIMELLMIKKILTFQYRLKYQWNNCHKIKYKNKSKKKGIKIKY